MAIHFRRLAFFPFFLSFLLFFFFLRGIAPASSSIFLWPDGQLRRGKEKKKKKKKKKKKPNHPWSVCIVSLSYHRSPYLIHHA
ncbi:hypothetical protein BDDG_12066 [Blastomyces dermatitidis ATCC 18188]|uniref:Uncharacterized protein n=1 Tax=Ajellomyces dermatitidis (strain ATCC 18188 / CBS 674.68) TaxID=653446 RepID=A0A0J9EMN5_AJEDA|nr:hypothetical protein BDDG_12066 [Blastomyces dermatitidis ATCC 18188]